MKLKDYSFLLLRVLFKNKGSRYFLLFAFCFLLSAFCLLPSAYPQNPNCYRISFSDKNDSPYSINHPEEYLSPRAIAKRERFNIPIIEQDLPVNPHYIDSILHFSTEPSQIISQSKWDNSVVIFYPETENCHNIIADMLNHFSFVIDTLPVAYYKLPFATEESIHNESSIPQQTIEDNNNNSSCDYNYGKSIDNIKLHNGELLHKAGFCGQGMLICVNDAGYENFNTIPYFQSLYENGQIWGTRDLVPGLGDVYMGHSPWTGHGTAVVSIMASTIEGQLIGSAPKANYFLFRTCIPFDNNLTNLAEEDFWAYAAEIADSLGADVMSASMGYKDNFDFDWQNIYTPTDNDGVASIISRAVATLAQKGVIVVNAAGNEGLTEWKYLLRPADAYHILAVGGVSQDGFVTQYSSYGPSADGRIKPDVASLSFNNWYVKYDGTIVGGNTGFCGTSAAAPIIAGLSACLWQALHQYSSLEIMQLIREYGSRANTPNNRIGYGIPNFYQCYLDHVNKVPERKSLLDVEVYPNPTRGELRVTSDGLRVMGVEVFDVLGRRQKAENTLNPYSQKAPLVAEGKVVLDISTLQAGIYFVRIQTEKGIITKKIVKY